MNIKTLIFTKDLPDSEGQFIINWLRGGYQLITVYFRPKEWRYGVEWEEGYFMLGNDKHVSHINLDMVEGIAKL